MGLQGKDCLKRGAELPDEVFDDVECRSDSLAVISYRDINVFTYVNTSDACLRRSLATTTEDADLIKKHQRSTHLYFMLSALIVPTTPFQFLAPN